MIRLTKFSHALSALGIGFSLLTLPLYSVAAEPSNKQEAVGVELSSKLNEHLVDSLPNPLTLDYVLSLPLYKLPQMQYQQAQINQLQAQQDQQVATDKTQLSLVGRLGWREFAEETQDDNLAALHLNHKLYDFNQS